MHSLLLACTVVAVLGGACAPLVELEDENVALRADVDSLAVLLAECRSDAASLRENLSVAEARILALDDHNRELSAALAEAEYAGTPTPADAPNPDAPNPDAPNPDAPNPDASVADAGSRTSESERRDAGSHAGTASPVLTTGEGAYDGRVPPGIDFLGRYQTALSAYNARQYSDALRQFADLIATARPNDMIDNCLYWMGESALQLGRHDDAVLHFTRVLGCADADKVDDALYSRALAHKAAGRRTEARADLDRLLREFPHSEFTGQARAALKIVR